MKCWQLQEAKAHLSKLVKEVITHGPQEISLHGEPVVIVVSKKEYAKLKKPKLSLVDFMRQSLLAESGFIIKRDKSLTRKMKSIAL